MTTSGQITEGVVCCSWLASTVRVPKEMVFLDALCKHHSSRLRNNRLQGILSDQSTCRDLKHAKDQGILVRRDPLLRTEAMKAYSVGPTTLRAHSSRRPYVLADMEAANSKTWKANQGLF